MSWEASAYVKKLRGLTRTERVFLFVLADYHSTETNTAWPATTTLVDDCEMSEASVKRARRSLARKGIITTEASPGGSLTYRFTALTPTLSSGVNLTPGVTAMTPKPPDVVETDVSTTTEPGKNVANQHSPTQEELKRWGEIKEFYRPRPSDIEIPDSYFKACAQKGPPPEVDLELVEWFRMEVSEFAGIRYLNRPHIDKALRLPRPGQLPRLSQIATRVKGINTDTLETILRTFLDGEVMLELEQDTFGNLLQLLSDKRFASHWDDQVATWAKART